MPPAREGGSKASGDQDGLTRHGAPGSLSRVCTGKEAGVGTV